MCVAPVIELTFALVKILRSFRESFKRCSMFSFQFTLSLFMYFI